MKAFDTVNHEILLKKAFNMGLRGYILAWIKKYLTDREQCTISKGIVSNFDILTCGVPQGSVCGPLLFLIYIHDLPHILSNSKVSL